MPIRSVCPKCGLEGTQSIYYKPSKSKPQRQYLVFNHGKTRCFIGRVRNTEEAMLEFEKESTTQDYARSLGGISKDIRNLIKSYSPNTAVRMGVISRKLIDILQKYGY